MKPRIVRSPRRAVLAKTRRPVGVERLSRHPAFEGIYDLFSISDLTGRRWKYILSRPTVPKCESQTGQPQTQLKQSRLVGALAEPPPKVAAWPFSGRQLALLRPKGFSPADRAARSLLTKLTQTPVLFGSLESARKYQFLSYTLSATKTSNVMETE
ncbi:hypothetical protein J6590_098896 [Homalodisca vitripennis]|nr:hypothetical protein J6590_098896 [Homalodisca vitripennis]